MNQFFGDFLFFVGEVIGFVMFFTRSLLGIFCVMLVPRGGHIVKLGFTCVKCHFYAGGIR